MEGATRVGREGGMKGWWDGMEGERGGVERQQDSREEFHPYLDSGRAAEC